MSDSASYVGGCLCGSVRYKASGTPIIEGNCHCRDCQRSSGSGYTPVMFFPAPTVAISGKVQWFDHPGGSGAMVARGFCPRCGSQLFGKPERMPGLIGVRAGTLDDPSIFQPKADVFTSRAAHWDFMGPNTAKFEEVPPMPPAS